MQTVMVVRKLFLSRDGNLVCQPDNSRIIIINVLDYDSVEGGLGTIQPSIIVIISSSRHHDQDENLFFRISVTVTVWQYSLCSRSGDILLRTRIEDIMMDDKLIIITIIIIITIKLYTKSIVRS